jgi:hypothetical protein
MYSELVQYHQNRVDSISELERRLESSGYGVGLKVLDLLAFRSREVRTNKRLRCCDTEDDARRGAICT